MECEHRVFPDTALGVLWLRGDVASHDMLECLSRLSADGLWRPSFSTLWDARAIRQLTIVPTDLDLLLERAMRPPDRSPGRVAIIVARQIEYQILSLLLIQRDSNPRIPKVFCGLPSALGWLGIEETPEMLGRLSAVSYRPSVI
jgi:hypothetical protein